MLEIINGTRGSKTDPPLRDRSKVVDTGEALPPGVTPPGAVTRIGRIVANSPSADDAVIVVLADEEAPSFVGCFELRSGTTVVIGRESDADISLRGAVSVSRRHAEIVNRKGRLRFRDCGSTNGSWVNGRPTAGARLHSGDSIRLGSVRLKVFLRGDLEGDFFVTMHERVFLDGLTGALTRTGFDRDLLAETGRALRHDHPLGLILFDIDHFKNVNDRWGHVVGDHVLIRLVEVVQSVLRTGQRISRIGGEEFAVLCPETEIDGAMVLADRLRVGIEGMGGPGLGSKAGHVSCSFGVAGLTQGMCAKDLFAAADAALYRAKNEGRNCVCGPMDIG